MARNVMVVNPFLPSLPMVFCFEFRVESVLSPEPFKLHEWVRPRWIGVLFSFQSALRNPESDNGCLSDSSKRCGSPRIFDYYADAFLPQIPGGIGCHS